MITGYLASNKIILCHSVNEERPACLHLVVLCLVPRLPHGLLNKKRARIVLTWCLASDAMRDASLMSVNKYVYLNVVPLGVSKAPKNI